MGKRFSEGLRDETLRILKEHGWSRRGAEIATGVSYTLIQHMSQGLPPSPTRICEWADAIGEKRSKWLLLAGHSDMLSLLAGETRMEILTRELGPILDELVHESKAAYPAEDELVALVRAAAPEVREAVLTLLRVSKRDGE